MYVNMATVNVDCAVIVKCVNVVEKNSRIGYVRSSLVASTPGCSDVWLPAQTHKRDKRHDSKHSTVQPT